MAVKQSGELIGIQTKISEHRSPYLLWLAATVASFKDPALSQYMNH